MSGCAFHMPININMKLSLELVKFDATRKHNIVIFCVFELSIIVFTCITRLINKLVV